MNKYLFLTLISFIMVWSGCVQTSTTNDTSKDWQWRGENRDGIYNETGLLKEWPADGPELLWTFDRLGEGHTSVAISNEKTSETKYKVLDIGRSNIISADGMLYCYSDRGEMFLVKPNPEQLEIVSSFKVTLGTDQHWAHPVIYKGVLYLRHGDTLMAYKIK